MTTFYSTPDPTLLLSSDGILVARAPGLEARDPTRDELPEAMAAAFGRVIDRVDPALVTKSPPQLLKSEHDLNAKVRKVYEKVPVAGHSYEFLFAVLDLMGWLDTRDPLLEQVKIMDGMLHAYFAHVDAQIFAAWSSTRLAMLADVQSLASSARDTIRSIFQSKEDLQAPFTIARLALADQNSLLAVKTFEASVESGYWLRPYSGSVIDLDSWGAKSDDRALQNGDGTVWDPRLALPTLLYALTVRMVVLRTLYSERRQYCHEVKQHVDFLLGVQMHWQTGIRRKTKLSTRELKIGAGFSVRPFAAGAVDVFTGQHDFIDVDAMALNLLFARGLWGGPLPPEVAPIAPELIAPTITYADIDQRFETEYRAILDKQSAVAFTRLRWSTGLQALSDTIKSLGMICAGPGTEELVSVYRDSLPLVRESGDGLKPSGAWDGAQERVELARALARVTQPRGERSEARAMADRYALYCAVKDEDTPLVSELRELVARHVSRPRPWNTPREGRPDKAVPDRMPEVLPPHDPARLK
jgi:hypothetical protein